LDFGQGSCDADGDHIKDLPLDLLNRGLRFLLVRINVFGFPDLHKILDSLGSA
jgi:hypothetical protein